MKLFYSLNVDEKSMQKQAIEISYAKWNEFNSAKTPNLRLLA